MHRPSMLGVQDQKGPLYSCSGAGQEGSIHMTRNCFLSWCFARTGAAICQAPTFGTSPTYKHSTSETSLWVRHLNSKDQRVFGPHVRHAKRSHLASSAGCAWLQLYSHLLARGQDSSSKMHCSTLVVSLILTTGSGDGRSLLFGSTW